METIFPLPITTVIFGNTLPVVTSTTDTLPITRFWASSELAHSVRRTLDILTMRLPATVLKYNTRPFFINESSAKVLQRLARSGGTFPNGSPATGWSGCSLGVPFCESTRFV